MSFLSKIKNRLLGDSEQSVPMESGGFDYAEYDRKIHSNICEFEEQYNLNDAKSIQSITPEDAKEWGARAEGVPSLPEQILFKKATEHKKNGNLNLAIECLKKANELLPTAECSYQRSDYERLVNYLVSASRFDEARVEHAQLDAFLGTTINFLENLKRLTSKSAKEEQEYDEQIIAPARAEEKDREEYYWLLENMKSIAPKSFSGYRRMKSGNTENYQKIIKQVGETGVDLSQVRFWK